MTRQTINRVIRSHFRRLTNFPCLEGLEDHKLGASPFCYRLRGHCLRVAVVEPPIDVPCVRRDAFKNQFFYLTDYARNTILFLLYFLSSINTKL
jgi:hypothetical protein